MEISPSAHGDCIVHHVCHFGQYITYVTAIIDCYVILKFCGLLYGFPGREVNFSDVFT